MSAPNLIERLDEIAAAIDRLRSALDHCHDPFGHMGEEIDYIEGVVGEILTMVDGR